MARALCDMFGMFGIGGLGAYAVQLARAAGALEAFAVDRKPEKLRLAADYGAVPVDPAQGNVVDRIFELTRGQGVDIALEMAGRRETVAQALGCVGHLGRAVVVGLSQEPVSIDTSRELLHKEAELIGSNDHLLRELPLLVELARRRAIPRASSPTSSRSRPQPSTGALTRSSTSRACARRHRAVRRRRVEPIGVPSVQGRGCRRRGRAR